MPWRRPRQKLTLTILSIDVFELAAGKGRGRLLFVNKKKQKNSFCSWAMGVVADTASGPAEHKFLRRFFLKAAAFLICREGTCLRRGVSFCNAGTKCHDACAPFFGSSEEVRRELELADAA
jgi:hypothetical protein